MSEDNQIKNPDDLGEYAKAIKAAGCSLDADYGGLTLKDDITAIDGCHTVQAYKNIAGVALEDVKHGLGTVANGVSSAANYVSSKLR